ncbi:WYL domain-containing protein [Nocardioides sp. ChNu-153]|uniref:helix-turn-helix transcriptional regulator n=1 Tax=unclassified Nocardioides TaxID=2615069 RepID=UPI002406E3C0|nr:MULTISPECIES: WYL domain-containing protein [unclassified Nocardioides]MDF9715109.1 WYL domain-containing protein [Nocardioides sp. ChNu-99]MDN7122378.1 WYL domain-containing protein [Nocardioides sp. ChNu-153]
MSTTSSRLLALLSLLQSRRDWPGEVLADRLEVSGRTVRRDVDRLRELGYRITATKGPDGGYRLDAGSDLPPLLFDDDQAVALAVALQVVARGGSGLGTAVGEAALRALTSVRQVLPGRLRHRLDALPLEVVGMPPGSGSARAEVDGAVLVALGAAVHAREVLRFDYVSAAGAAGGAAGEPDAGPRRAEPHHLVTWRGRWYLVGWDLDGAEWRTFRADRITPRVPNGPRFAPRELPGGVDVATYVVGRFRGAAAGGVAWPCTGEVVVDLPVGRVAPFAGDGVVEAVGVRRTRLIQGAWSWPALAASLLRYDADLEVVGPPELVEAFRELGERCGRAAEGAAGGR